MTSLWGGLSPSHFSANHGKLLQVILGVVMYLDDILVMGPNEKEHLQNL